MGGKSFVKVSLVVLKGCRVDAMFSLQQHVVKLK